MNFKKIENANTFLSWANKKARNNLEIAYKIKQVNDLTKIRKARAYASCLFNIMSAQLDIPRSVLVHAFVTNHPKAIHSFLWRREYKKYSEAGNLHEMSVPEWKDYESVVKQAFAFASLVNVKLENGEDWF